MPTNTFAAAAAALQGAGDDTDLCGPIASALRVTGVSVSTLGDSFGSETVCALDEASARLDEIQLDLGEGPCWDAVRQGRPVLEPNLQGSVTQTWPLAMQAMRETGIGAVFAFPMRVGTIDVGAVDLYSADAGALSSSAVRDATMLTDIVARQVLHRALAATASPDGGGPLEGRYSRRELHQATGMIAAQLGISVDDARLILGGRAFADGRTLMEVASDVIARKTRFTPVNDDES